MHHVTTYEQTYLSTHESKPDPSRRNGGSRSLGKRNSDMCRLGTEPHAHASLAVLLT